MYINIFTICSKKLKLKGGIYLAIARIREFFALLVQTRGML